MKRFLVILGLICLFVFFMTACTDSGTETDNGAAVEPAKEIQSSSTQADEAKSEAVEETSKDESSSATEETKETASDSTAATAQANKETDAGKPHE